MNKLYLNNQIFLKFNRLIQDFYNNFEIEDFHQQCYEDNDSAIQRGEKLLQKYQQNISNVNEMLYLKNEINDFFDKCEENKQLTIKQKNKLIDNLIRTKKNDINIDKETFIKYKSLISLSLFFKT